MTRNSDLGRRKETLVMLEAVYLFDKHTCNIILGLKEILHSPFKIYWLIFFNYFTDSYMIATRKAPVGRQYFPVIHRIEYKMFLLVNSKSKFTLWKLLNVK